MINDDDDDDFGDDDDDDAEGRYLLQSAMNRGRTDIYPDNDGRTYTNGRSFVSRSPPSLGNGDDDGIAIFLGYAERMGWVRTR